MAQRPHMTDWLRSQKITKVIVALCCTVLSRCPTWHIGLWLMVSETKPLDLLAIVTLVPVPPAVFLFVVHVRALIAHENGFAGRACGRALAFARPVSLFGQSAAAAADLLLCAQQVVHRVAAVHQPPSLRVHSA